MSRVRQSFREQLASGRLLQFPGAFSPLVAKTGGPTSASTGSTSRGRPCRQTWVCRNIGLTTLIRGGGPGGSDRRGDRPAGAARRRHGLRRGRLTWRAPSAALERGRGGGRAHRGSGQTPSAVAIVDHKQVVSTADMVRRIRAAVDARTDPRLRASAPAPTPARSRASTRRSSAPAPTSTPARTWCSPRRWRARRSSQPSARPCSVPLLANMTEFGKPLLDVATLTELGLQPGHLSRVTTLPPGHGRDRGRPAHPPEPGHPGFPGARHARPASGSMSSSTTPAMSNSTPGVFDFEVPGTTPA